MISPSESNRYAEPVAGDNAGIASELGLWSVFIFSLLSGVSQLGRSAAEGMKWLFGTLDSYEIVALLPVSAAFGDFVVRVQTPIAVK